MKNLKIGFFILVGAFVGACAGGPTSSLPRKPAQSSEDSQPNPPPPFATPKDAWVYSWTFNPAALQDPKSFIQRDLEHAQSCLPKLASAKDSDDLIQGCEGNGMMAGPGFYTCDDPFASHDYGTTVIVTRVKGNDRNLALATGSLAPPPASGGFDRSLVGQNFDGIVYDFRLTDQGDRALVIRSDRTLDMDQTFAVQLAPPTYQSFHDHAAFACQPETGLAQVLQNWGDHFEFLAVTSNSSKAGYSKDEKGFESDGVLTKAGMVAAVASNAIAMSDADLKQKVDALSKIDKSVKDSFAGSACAETESQTLRACLYRRLIDSVLGNRGNPDNPTYAWPLKTTMKVLSAFGIGNAHDFASVKTNAALKQVLANRFKADATGLQRAGEAIGCMRIFKDQARENGFNKWGEDP